MVLGQTEVVGHESAINGEAGFGWEVDDRVSGVAGWEQGVREWVWLVKAEELWLGILLWWSLVGLQYHIGAQDAWFAGKGCCDAGCQVVDRSG